ncbi:hypothetical protein Tco_0371534 [Tanacetum coccineum]
MPPTKAPITRTTHHTTTTTSVTNAQLQTMIDQGVTTALAARTEGVVELTQWFERMETVFRISHCSVENQIKFSTCTLLAGALRGGIPTSTKFRKYDGVLPDMIHGSFCGVKTKTMHEATEMAQVDGQKDPTLSNAAGLSKGYKNVELFHVQQVQAAPIMDHVLVKCGKLARRIGHNDPRLSDWPKLKNQDHGNQAKDTRARGLVHALGGGETDQDVNNIEDEIEA